MLEHSPGANAIRCASEAVAADLDGDGLIVGHYEREGEIQIGDTTLDSPSEREIARRQR